MRRAATYEPSSPGAFSVLLAEIEAVDADAAWTSVSDDPAELAESQSLRRQADALRRALADLDRQIASALDRQ
ncbi:MAG TPA: hypothetical protein VHH53_06975 [Pseudonocardiaceae bacterium]|nr:hypothetical protein [Pseudonocardiaceae bacterium]